MMQLYQYARSRDSDYPHTLSPQTRGPSALPALRDPSSDSNHPFARSQTTREVTEISLYLSVSGISQ